MITQVLVDYLKDENVSIEKKGLFVERLDLQYSDLFRLKEIFSCDGRVNRMLYCFIYYHDNNFESKINYQNRKKKNNAKQKRMRRGMMKDAKH